MYEPRHVSSDAVSLVQDGDDLGQVSSLNFILNFENDDSGLIPLVSISVRHFYRHRHYSVNHGLVR